MLLRSACMPHYQLSALPRVTLGNLDHSCSSSCPWLLTEGRIVGSSPTRGSIKSITGKDPRINLTPVFTVPSARRAVVILMGLDTWRPFVFSCAQPGLARARNGPEACGTKRYALLDRCARPVIANAAMLGTFHANRTSLPICSIEEAVVMCEWPSPQIFAKLR